MIYVSWLLLTLGLAVLTSLESPNSWLQFSIVLLVGAYILWGVDSGKWLPAKPFIIPGVLFLISGGLSAWLAYDRPLAILQLSRIMAVGVLFVFLSQSNRRTLEVVTFLLSLSIAVLALYFPLQYNYLDAPVKFAWVTQIGQWVNANFHPPDFSGFSSPTIHPNVAAGTLAAGLPLAIGGMWVFCKQKRYWLSVLFVLFSIIILFGLLMTASRGGLLAVLGGCGIFVLILTYRRWITTRQRRWAFWTVVFLLAIAGLWLSVGVVGLDQVLGKIPGPYNTLIARTRLWRVGLQLAMDYFFTGIGLRMFWMVYSVYGMLIHVPYVAHAHNTFLQVWIEQGVLGFASLIWGCMLLMKLAWITLHNQEIIVWRWIGLLSLAVVALHGLVDVVFYVERTLPLLGIILGMAVWRVDNPKESSLLAFPGKWKNKGLLTLVGAFLILIVVYQNPLRAQLFSNFGALQQTSAELGVYDPRDFNTKTLEDVRGEVDLSTAMMFFQNALAFNSTNRTANQRMAEINFSRGEYDTAYRYVDALWSVGFRDDVTRMLRSDILIATGNPEEAGRLVVGIPFGKERIMYQAFYLYWRNADYVRAMQAWQAVLAIDPQNQRALEGVEQARKKLSP